MIAFDNIIPNIPDAAVRVSVSTRTAIKLMVSIPLLGNLMLQVKWPHPDPEINGLKSVERDIKLGIGQGCFNKMPLAIGVSLDIGSMIGG